MSHVSISALTRALNTNCILFQGRFICRRYSYSDDAGITTALKINARIVKRTRFHCCTLSFSVPFCRLLDLPFSQLSRAQRTTFPTHCMVTKLSRVLVAVLSLLLVLRRYSMLQRGVIKVSIVFFVQHIVLVQRFVFAKHVLFVLHILFVLSNLSKCIF